MASTEYSSAHLFASSDGGVTWSVVKLDGSGNLAASLIGALPTGGNTIGNVGLVAGSASVGTVGLNTGTNSIGNVGLNAGGNTIGNVGLTSAIPTGANTIGNVGLNTGSNTIGFAKLTDGTNNAKWDANGNQYVTMAGNQTPVSINSTPITINAATDTSATFSAQVRKVLIQNNREAVVYVDFDQAAGLGTLTIAAGGALSAEVRTTVVHFYSVAGDTLNATTAGHIVMRGWA